MHLRHWHRKPADAEEVKEGDWVVVLVDLQTHRQLAAGVRCEFVPGHDLQLEGPNVHVLIETCAYRTVAVRVGPGMSISAGAEALQKALEFAKAANAKLEPEDRMKASLPLDVRKWLQRFLEKLEAKQQRQKETQDSGAAAKKPRLQGERFYMAPNGLGMCSASAVTESGKPLHLDLKNFRNHGVRQWLGAHKLGQNIGDRESVKLGNLSFSDPCTVATKR